MLGLAGVAQELHAGMAAMRRAAARAVAREAAAEGAACSLCMERPQGVVFGCGHQVQPSTAWRNSQYTRSLATYSSVRQGAAQKRC